MVLLFIMLILFAFAISQNRVKSKLTPEPSQKGDLKVVENQLNNTKAKIR